MKKYFVALGLFSLITLVILLVLILTMDKPPLEEFAKYRELISKAKKVNADGYAPENFQAAETKYKAAFIEWKRENEKIFFQRNYSKTKDLIIDAIVKAELALSTSGTNKNNQKSTYLKEIELLRKKLQSYHDLFIKLPLTVQVRKDYEFGKLAMEESINAFEKGDYLKANKKLNEGKTRISYADKEVSAQMKQYFGHLGSWKAWAQSTIDYSLRNGTYALLVDKMKHKAYLYYKGKVTREYDVEFGKNWIGDKMHSGDNATPEGKYYVTKKKGPRESRYYKALLINYPNEDDRISFNQRKKNGQVGKGRGIGGLIEVHGNGGKGVDWTQGCVALTDSNMDDLFGKMSVGSPVTIVGSLNSLDDLLN